MSQLDSTCTSSGINRALLSRAVSFRLSRQPSFVYPFAVTRAERSGPPVALSVWEAHPAKNIEATTVSVAQKRFIATSRNMYIPTRLGNPTDFKERGAGCLHESTESPPPTFSLED